jgi:hypothetical protein
MAMLGDGTDILGRSSSRAAVMVCARSWRAGPRSERHRSCSSRRSAAVMVRPRQPREARSKTAQTSVRELVSPGAGGEFEQGSGDGADGRRGHDHYGVAGDGDVAADLGVIEAEAVLASAELLFHRPSQSCGADQPGQRQRLAGRT